MEGCRDVWRNRSAPGRRSASAVCREGEGRHRVACAQGRPVPARGCSRPPAPPQPPLPARPPGARRPPRPPRRCAGAGCRCLNLSAAARNQKSRRSFPVDIHGAFSAPAVPSPAAPGMGRAAPFPPPDTGTEPRVAPPPSPDTLTRGSR